MLLVLKMYDCGDKIKLLLNFTAKLLQINHQDKQIYVNAKNKWENELLQLIRNKWVKIYMKQQTQTIYYNWYRF